MGGIDARFDQPHELVEDRILQGDWKRQDAIEPALDRRKIIDHRPVGCFDPEASQLLKAPEADRFKLAGEQRSEERSGGKGGGSTCRSRCAPYHTKKKK